MIPEGILARNEKNFKGLFAAFLFLQQIQEVCTIAQQHGDAMPANQLFLPQGAQQENHTGSNGDHGIDAEIGGEGHRNDHGGQAHHEENIENIGADDVADGDVGIALPGSSDRGEELRQGSTQSHNSQTDEAFAETEDPGQSGSGIHSHIGFVPVVL